MLNPLKHWFRRPLSCEDVNRFILDYVEGDLPPEVQTRFEAHLAMCPACRPYFDQYNHTIKLIREQGSADFEVPEEIVETTLAFLQKHLDGLEDEE